MTVDVKHKFLEISHHLRADDWTSVVVGAPSEALVLTVTHDVPTAPARPYQEDRSRRPPSG